VLANEFERTASQKRKEGLPILGGSPFLEETGERIYYSG
jgi:hypothetical protein